MANDSENKKQEDDLKPDEVKIASNDEKPTIKIQDSLRPKEEKDESTTSVKETTVVFTPSTTRKHTTDDDKTDTAEPTRNTKALGFGTAAPPDGMNRTESKMMRRPTGYINAQALKNILKAQNRYDEEEEEEDEDESDATSAPEVANNNGDDDEANQPLELDEAMKPLDDLEKKNKDVKPATASSKRDPSVSAVFKLDQRPTRRSNTESDQALRESVIRRLYEDSKQIEDDEEPPTLKNYRPISERIPKNLLLTFGQCQLAATESNKDTKGYMRPSLTIDAKFEEVANVQYGHKVKSKISQDYIQRLNQMEQEPRDKSFGAIEYASRRPCISVADYRRRNKERLEKIKHEERKKRDKKIAEDPLLKHLLIKDEGL